MKWFRRRKPCRNCVVLRRWGQLQRRQLEALRQRAGRMEAAGQLLEARLEEQRRQYEDELLALRALANTLAAERIPTEAESLRDLQLALAAKAEEEGEPDAPFSEEAHHSLSDRLDQVYFSTEPPATTVWAKDLLKDDDA